MGRAASFSAPRAMAEEEAVEGAVDVEANGSAQAGAGNFRLVRGSRAHEHSLVLMSNLVQRDGRIVPIIGEIWCAGF